MAMSWLCVLSGSVPCIEDCRGRAPARIVSKGVNSGVNFDMGHLNSVAYSMQCTVLALDIG